MHFPNATPEEGPSKRAESFRYVPTPNGSKPWTGWLAADPWWCQAHSKPRPTKPCVSWLTHTQLSCRRCSVSNPPELVGYLFLWRESDLMPCCVVVQECSWDHVAKLLFKDYVELSRAIEEGSPLSVRKCIRQKTWTSKHRLRQHPVDMVPCLLQMWDINELTEWVRCQTPQSDRPVSQPSGKKGSKTIDEFDPMLRAAARRAGFPPATETEELRSVLEGTLSRIKEQEKKAQSNGKHDPPPSG